MLDPGGMYKVKGNNPAAAREIQKVFNKKMDAAVKNLNEIKKNQGREKWDQAYIKEYGKIIKEITDLKNKKGIEFNVPKDIEGQFAFAVRDRMKTGWEVLSEADQAKKKRGHGELEEGESIEEIPDGNGLLNVSGFEELGGDVKLPEMDFNAGSEQGDMIF